MVIVVVRCHAIQYLRVRDCCECFVYKYTHEHECTMNEKFCMLHEAAGAFLSSLYIQQVRVFVNKTRT